MSGAEFQNGGDALLVTVRDIDTSVVGVRRVRLERIDAQAAPSWTPGTHIDLELPNGLVRQYSLCGDLDETEFLEIAVLLEDESRGGSSYMHNALRVGDELRITGMRNHFNFDAAIERAVLIAGGIGITPLLSMIAALSERGVPWSLHYAGRSRDRMAYLQELTERYGERVVTYISSEGPRLDLAAMAASAGGGTVFYACGPDRMLVDVEAIVGPVAADRLRVERFRPREEAGATVSAAFTVELAESGVEVEVPSDRSILDVVREAGVDVPSSCEEGTCGTCETTVLEGDPDHRDSVLSELEREVGDCMMICVSRSCGRKIVLDL